MHLIYTVLTNATYGIFNVFDVTFNRDFKPNCSGGTYLCYDGFSYPDSLSQQYVARPIACHAIVKYVK